MSEYNLTERLMIELSKKDMKNFKNLAKKECLKSGTLAQKIILLYLKKEILNS